MRGFTTKELAIEWAVSYADDACVDNERFAFVDDPKAVSEYEKQKDDGCCGFLDETVMVNGKLAMVGCNYGH